MDCDITECDLQYLGLFNKKKNVVIHFDDHVNALERIDWCRKMGFKHLIFEDNYPVGKGNCVSLKQHPEVTRTFKQYEEFPPILNMEKDRWGQEWESREPLFDSVDLPPEFIQEAYSYTWICYVEL